MASMVKIVGRTPQSNRDQAMNSKPLRTAKQRDSDAYETLTEKLEEIRVKLAAATECCRSRAVGPMLVAIRKAHELA